MSQTRINFQILKKISEICDSDAEIGNFLKDLIIEEADHPGKWWWKDVYINKIKEHVNGWDHHED
jgi:hypothetical protein